MIDYRSFLSIEYCKILKVIASNDNIGYLMSHILEKYKCQKYKWHI